jgi:antirestriction protein ArdC
MAEENFNSVADRVLQKIDADLEQGVRTWMKPWSAIHADGRVINFQA